MPNDYTLYIDESGDFGKTAPDYNSSHTPWILSGILCAASASVVPPALVAATDPLRLQFQTEFPNFKNFFHLTELREFLVAEEGAMGYEHTVSLAREVLDRVTNLSFEVRFFTVNNVRRVRAQGHQDGNYLMMLPELVAQVDASLSMDQKPDSLTIYVSKRMKMNDRNDIDYSMDQIHQSVTMGLASRGLAGLLEKNRLEIVHEVADRHRGCQMADFVANTVANAKKPETKALVQELTQSGKLTQFFAFGSYRERKARILERDGDFAGALRAWMAVEAPEQDGLPMCLERAVQRSGDSLRAITDSIIEHVWQEYRFSRNYAEIYPQLARFEKAFSRYVNDPEKKAGSCLPALFRFRTYQLSISNHLGNAPDSEKLVGRQEDARRRLDITPENFPLLLQYDMTYLVTLENAMQIEELGKRNARYRDLIQQYEACWSLIYETVIGAPAAKNAFHQSRLHIAAETSLPGQANPYRWLGTAQFLGATYA